MDYWQECISEGFDEAGIIATQAQIDIVAEWVEGAKENESQARGWDCIPDPRQEELVRLREELARERGRMRCRDCHGTGYFAGGECYSCNGKGWVY